MNSWMYGTVLLACGAAAVLLVADLVRDRNTQDSHFVALGLIEVAVLVQAVWGGIAVARTDRDVSGVTLVSYLATIVLVPVVGGLLALTERSRVGTGIMLLAVATVAAMEARIIDIWSAHG